MLGALEKLQVSIHEELENLDRNGAAEQKEIVIKEEKVRDPGKYPRISLFYEEQGKGEVNYRTWKYEVNCLIKEKMYYSKDSLLLGIRRSLRGEAAAMAMRLGESASMAKVLDKFHAAFCNTKTPESILNKRAQRALGRSPEEKVKGNSGANYRKPKGHNLNNFGRGPFDDVIY